MTNREQNMFAFIARHEAWSTKRHRTVQTSLIEMGADIALLNRLHESPQMNEAIIRQAILDLGTGIHLGADGPEVSANSIALIAIRASELALLKEAT